MGINAAATTLMAFLRLPVQRLFFEKEDFEHLNLSLSALGGVFVKYIVFMILVHHIALVSIETFSYHNIFTILMRIISSSALTFILMLAIEMLSLKTKKT